MEISKRYSRRKRKKKAPDTEHPIDRLSDLPDAVLCHILSFMTTTLSVETSILSRRWRFVWTGVPTLDFDGYYNFCGERYCEIIDRVMALHKVKTLNSFCLCLQEDEECGQNQIEACVNSAIARNAKKIHVSLNYVVVPPPSLLTCKTVVDLTISDFRWSDMPVCLPALKKFSVEYLFYEYDDSLERLLLGCPALEDLTIRRISGDFAGYCNIALPTLIRLTMETESWLSDDVPSHRLLINAPALKYLWINDELYEHMSAGELLALLEADIWFHNYGKKDDVLYSRTVLEFLARLCNVKYIKLKMIYVKIIGSEFSSWTTKFHNLTKLELDSDWRFISMFLENADNLETLIVTSACEDMKCWVKPREVPTCLSSHLRTLRFSCFKRSDSEFEMVRYLLKNSKVLKRMEIHCWFYCMDVLENLKKKFEATQKILLFERGSEECVVAFD